MVRIWMTIVVIVVTVVASYSSLPSCCLLLLFFFLWFPSLPPLGQFDCVILFCIRLLLMATIGFSTLAFVVVPCSCHHEYFEIAF